MFMRKDQIKTDNRDHTNEKQGQNGYSRRDFIKSTATGAGAAALTGLGVEAAKAEGRPARWDKEADVVVIGAGATGLPAAIQAAEGGASVVLIDANTDVGGHAILSGGNVALGGGTSRQKKYGVVRRRTERISRL